MTLSVTNLGVASLRVPLYLGRGEDHPEGREGVVQQLLVHLRVQVTDEDVGAHVQVLLVGGGLVHPHLGCREVREVMGGKRDVERF